MKTQVTKTAATFIINKGSKMAETNVQAIERLQLLRDSIPADTQRRRKNIEDIDRSISSLRVSLTAQEHFNRMKQ